MSEGGESPLKDYRDDSDTYGGLDEDELALNTLFLPNSSDIERMPTITNKGLLWKTSNKDIIRVNKNGQMATKTDGNETSTGGRANPYDLITTDTEMRFGKHYWEVEICL
jgi:hypothetical protein